MRKNLALAALVLGLCGTAARAEKETAPAHACAAETAKYCPKIKPGQPGWGRCVREHMDALSPKCKASFDGGGKQAGPAKVKTSPVEACGAERAKYCAGMKPGDGALGPCLKSHQAQLSPACMTFVRTMAAPEKARDAGEPCKADTAKFCAGMKPGDGKWGPCLRSHAAKLSASCKAEMASRGPSRKEQPAKPAPRPASPK